MEGERAAFTFFGTFNNGGRGTVSFLRQSIQLPRNRHRRWEDGKRQEGLLPPPFLSTPFLLSTFPPPLLEELDSLCLPPRNAREK